MKNPTHFIARILLLVLCLDILSGTVAAQESPELLKPLLIIELQTASSTSGKHEWVELHNPNVVEVDITGWQLQYRAASKTGDEPKDWQQLVNVLECDGPCNPVPANGRVVLASSTAAVSEAIVLAKDGMATESGQVRFMNTAGDVQDMVGYGQAATAEGNKPAPKLSAGKSIKRRISEDGYFIDTNSNGADFMGGCTPEPQASSSLLASCTLPQQSNQQTEEEQSQETLTGNTETQAESTNTEASTSFAPLLITELLPNPASPGQDSSDEFIELYNPGTQAVQAKGYSLHAGSDYRYRFIIGELSIAPQGFATISSAESHLTLSNSGSSVRVLDPAGAVIDEVTYGAAKDGQSWMRDDAGWHWTTLPTPAASNILALAAVKPATTSSPKSATKKAAAAPKVKAPAAPKATKKKEEATPVAATMGQTPPSPPNPHLWLLWPIGLLVVGYALYEYRQHIFRLFRRSSQHTVQVEAEAAK